MERRKRKYRVLAVLLVLAMCIQPLGNGTVPRVQAKEKTAQGKQTKEDPSKENQGKEDPSKEDQAEKEAPGSKEEVPETKGEAAEPEERRKESEQTGRSGKALEEGEKEEGRKEQETAENKNPEKTASEEAKAEEAKADPEEQSKEKQEQGSDTAETQNPGKAASEDPGVITEGMKTYSQEEIVQEIPEIYDGNLENDSRYASKTLLAETELGTFDTYGAASVYKAGNMYLLSYDTVMQTKQAFAELSRLDSIQSVEVDAVLETETVDRSAESPAPEVSELKKYLDSRQPQKEVTAAVIDTGYTPEDGAPEEKNGRILDAGYNASTSGEAGSIRDDNGHGTQMGSMILENTPDCVKIMPLKAANSQGRATVLSVYLAIQKAVSEGVDLIHISMNAKVSAASALLTEAVQEAESQGIPVVVSAGNDSRDTADVTPSNIKEAVAVGAVNADGTLAEYSNYGNAIDYVSFGDYRESRGTSNAAAYVSAAMAYCYAVGEDYQTVFQTYGRELADGKDSSREMIAYHNPQEIKTDAADLEKEKEEKQTKKGDKEASGKGEKTKEEDKEAGADPGALFVSTNYTYYVKPEGYYYITLRKGAVKEKYKVSVKINADYDPASSMYRYPGSQKITYRITDADNMILKDTNFNPKLAGSAFKTKRDKVEPQQPAAQRQYLFPIKLSFKSFDGYTIAYDPNSTETYEAYDVGFAKNYFLGDFDTNGMGITNFHRNDGGFDHHNVAIMYKENSGTVKFSGNGSDGYHKNQSKPGNKTLSYTDDSITLPSPGVIWKKTGYHIDPGKKAWRVGSSDSATYAADMKNSAESAKTLKKALNLVDETKTSVTLYANWTINTSTLKVNPNGGVWNGSADVQSFTQDYKTTKGIPVPVRTGFRFKGWTRSHENGKMSSLTKKATYTYGAAQGVTDTLTAQWEINTSTLKVNPNGGEWNGSAQAQSFLQNYNTLRSIPLPSRTGCRFKGWSRTNTYGKLSSLTSAATYTYGATHGVTDTLTAQWEINTSTLKVNPGGGVWNGSSQIQPFTQNYNTTKSIPLPTRTGYLFVEWIRANTYGKLSSLTSAATYTYGATHGVTDTITADWNPIKYRVRYHANAGGDTVTGSMADSIFEYNDEDGKLAVNAYVREHYNFVGWKDDKGKDYTDGQPVKNLASTQGAVINLYAQWEKKVFNVAYSGNDQSDGTNMLENAIWHGDNYQFRENVFDKTVTEKRETDDGTAYEAEQKYSFRGWGLKPNGTRILRSGDKQPANEFYNLAKANNTISDRPAEDSPYEEVLPLLSTESRLSRMSRGAAAKEYINLFAQWNAYPVIIPAPQPDIDEDGKPRIKGNTLFFYEGEEPTKKDLIAHLIVTDQEDGDLINKIKIKKIEYSNGAYVNADGEKKKGYTMNWETDMPDDYIFDTYYLEMEKDEVLTHMVTYEVTDSAGNTTTEVLPVKVKYNNFPEIQTKYHTFYYFKEEANRGIITAEELIGRAEAVDIEDGDKIKDKIVLEDFDPDELMMQTTSTADFEVIFKVTDRFKKTTYRTITVQVADSTALEAEELRYYTRFISLKYMDTLEPNSTWRQPENWAYLKSVLENEKPKETWYFKHEDVVKIQNWIFEDGFGHWKMGREANKEFVKLFSYCKKTD